MPETVTKEQFSQWMLILFSGAQCKPPAADVAVSGVPSEMMIWFTQLNDLTSEQLGVGVNYFLREGRGRPTIQKLRECAGVVNQAEQAWLVVRRSIPPWAGHSVSFDPITNATVRQLGGWARLCRMESTQLDFVRMQFIRAWERVRTRRLPDSETRALESGFEMASLPVLIDTRIGMSSVATTTNIGDAVPVKALTNAFAIDV